MRDPITLANAQDILEVLDDRFGHTATLIASQVPVSDWHLRIPEGFRNAHLQPFTSRMIFFLRKRWGLQAMIPTGFNPKRWEDGTYSVQGAAKVIGVSTETIFAWIYRHRLEAHQIATGTPWRIVLDEEQILNLKKSLRRRNPDKSPSKRKAS